MQPHPLAKIFWAQLVGFGAILRRNLGKLEVKFAQKISAKSKSCIPKTFDILRL